MNKIRQQKIRSALSLIVLLVIIFSCQIGLWNSIFPISDVHSHYVVMTKTECGPTDNSNQTAGTNDSSKDVVTLPSDRLFFIVIFYSFLSVLFIVLLKLENHVIFSYLKIIRLKYGGFKLFYYFSYLFSSGLIHPKIY